jgi:hypothetical protein
MSILDKIWKTRKKESRQEVLKTEKELANEQHEPWVGILRMDVDPNDIANGSFELDWNDIFVARLLKAGYQGKNDQEIVENWFDSVCYNVSAGTFENEMADPEKRKIIQHRMLGNGRTEHS